MPKRAKRATKPKKRKRQATSRDINQIAKNIVDAATGNVPEEDQEPPKDPMAVALGRRGGLKGGKARASRMTPEERSASARKAAQFRWN